MAQTAHNTIFKSFRDTGHTVTLSNNHAATERLPRGQITAPTSTHRNEWSARALDTRVQDLWKRHPPNEDTETRLGSSSLLPSSEPQGPPSTRARPLFGRNSVNTSHDTHTAYVGQISGGHRLGDQRTIPNARSAKDRSGKTAWNSGTFENNASYSSTDGRGSSRGDTVLEDCQELTSADESTSNRAQPWGRIQNDQRHIPTALPPQWHKDFLTQAQPSRLQNGAYHSPNTLIDEPPSGIFRSDQWHGSRNDHLNAATFRRSTATTDRAFTDQPLHSETYDQVTPASNQNYRHRTRGPGAMDTYDTGAPTQQAHFRPTSQYDRNPDTRNWGNIQPQPNAPTDDYDSDGRDISYSPDMDARSSVMRMPFSRPPQRSQMKSDPARYPELPYGAHGADWSPQYDPLIARLREQQKQLVQQYAYRQHNGRGYRFPYDYPQNHFFDIPAPYFSPLQMQQQMQQMHRMNMYPMGHPRSLPCPDYEFDPQKPLRSPFLEDFRTTNKRTRCWELRDIIGYVVEFCGDHHGSLFIQSKLEKAKADEKDHIFRELQPDALPLMKDVFGNYVLQKFFEHGDAIHKKILVEWMKGQVAELSKHTYGCRVVQKAINHVLVEQQAALIRELDSPQTVMDCVRNENGNHVIQVAVRVIPFQHIHFMVDVFYGEVDYLATHRYGCRVIQRLLEKVEAPLMISRLMHGLHQCSPQLIADQYGNYVPQHIMETGGPVDRDMVVNVVLKNLFSYSKQKFASNVVEKCVKHGNDHQRRQMMIELSADDGQSENKLLFLIRDGYGNYVIQSLLDHLNDADYRTFKAILEPQVTKALKMIPPAKQAENVARKMNRMPVARHDGPAYNRNCSAWHYDTNSSAACPPLSSYFRFRADPPMINTAFAPTAMPTPPLTVGGTESPMSAAFPGMADMSRQESRKNSNEMRDDSVMNTDVVDKPG